MLGRWRMRCRRVHVSSTDPRRPRHTIGQGLTGFTAWPPCGLVRLGTAKLLKNFLFGPQYAPLISLTSSSRMILPLQRFRFCLLVSYSR